MKARFLVVAAFLIVTITPLGAAIITVTSTNDSGPGSLRDTLASASDGDTIDASSITGTILLTNGELLVTNSVDVVGPGPDLLAVDGNQHSRVFHVGSNSVVSLSGLTVTNGAAQNYLTARDGIFIGGGIRNDSSTLAVSNCVIAENLAGGNQRCGGGGIGNINGTLTLSGCTLRGNSGELGGAIYNVGSRTLVPHLEGSTATLIIINCSLVGNSAVVGDIRSCNGGGICNWGNGGMASAVIVNSTISGNSAIIGGGIENNQASLELLNSTIAGNTAPAGGSGIDNEFGASLKVVNSTLSSNWYRAFGSIWGVSLFNYDSTVEIGSTILDSIDESVTIGNNGGTITSLGYNLITDAGVVNPDGGADKLTATGDQNNTDPMLGPLQDNGGPTFTCAPLCGSPAIDQGKNFSSATTDQRGNGYVRTFDDCVAPNAPGGDSTDIGAYEVQQGECPHAITVNCPANFRVDATSPSGATVYFAEPTASNGCAIGIICTPASGSRFPIGDTVVSCVATDSEGNTGTCSLAVHVRGATEQINDLTALVQSLNLNPCVANYLIWELQAASNALHRGNPWFACGDLDMFIFNVNIQTCWGRICPPYQGRILVRDAQRIQNVIGCHGEWYDPRRF
ncbi:MAG TPA: choice-of-anchor Q domain-containing protein [Verrucomicrobiae bacterium]|nr:choice-of-anchor Q domain-containing protein [Verrucomicrobiae bacterium]